tara:strand:- start:8783 stop:10000 length:1218 start_codon:yes stop_codon:yes gene_type:complete
MAITIEQTPILYTPVYNEMIYVISSTNSGNTNFKYVVDVVINSDSFRLTLFPHPSFGTAYIDIGKIIETYISSDIDASTYGFQENTNSIKSFSVNFGEQYGEPVVVFPSLTSASAFAWNGVIDFLEFQSYTGSGYRMDGSGEQPFLTDQPTNTIIRDDESAWVAGITGTSGIIGYTEIITKDSSGSTLQTVQVQNPFTDISVFDGRMVRFGCGTKNLNLIGGSLLQLGSQPIITASVASYTIQWKQLTGGAVSIAQTYTINNTCTRNNLYRFHFLNKRGGFDSFTFYRADTKRVSIKRDSYKKNAASLTAADAYGYETKARTNIAYNTRLKDNISVLSDWITEDESIWLEDLITSPEVYLDDSTYGLVSVNIKDNSYDIKQVATDKLFNLRISFEYGYDRFRQRY